MMEFILISINKIETVGCGSLFTEAVVIFSIFSLLFSLRLSDLAS